MVLQPLQRVFLQWNPVVDGGLVSRSSLTRLLLVMSNGQYKIKQESMYRSTVHPAAGPGKSSQPASHGPMIGLLQYCESGIDSSRTFVVATDFPGPLRKSYAPNSSSLYALPIWSCIARRGEAGPLLRWDL
jgi:hypothetical protein